MTDKTKLQTYNFLSKNKSIEDIKKQTNIKVKVIKNKRHSGQTYRIDNADHQLVNDEQIQNIDENLEIVATSLTNNEKEQETNNDIWTKLKNYLNLPTTNAKELIQAQRKIEKLENSNQELKNKIEALKQTKESDINLTKYTYNSVTIYDEKQRKKTGIEENLNHEKNIKIEPVSIKKFLSEQEKISNWKISKSEWITFISLSLLSITLLAIPVAVPALVSIISTILWEKTLVSIVGIGIAWIVNKGIWTIATEKIIKVESWMKQSFYSLIRKIPFVNKRNLGKTKEELEIKKMLKTL